MRLRTGSALAERAAEVGGEESERLLHVPALAASETPRGALNLEQRAGRREVRDAAPARQAAAVKEEKRLHLHAQLFERVPALDRAGRAVVHHDRLGLEDEQPPGARDAQTPLVVLAVHVKAFVKAADLFQHLAPDEH